MAYGVIPVILASGYGVSFRSIKFLPDKDEDFISFKFPNELSRGDLLLGYDNRTKVLFPMIRIGREVTVCVEFVVYVPDVGWKMIDLTAFPDNLDQLAAMTKNNELRLKMMETTRDMSKYEIINAWED